MFIWKKTYKKLVAENKKLRAENKTLAFKLDQYKKYYKEDK